MDKSEKTKAVRNTSSKHRTYSITINNPTESEQNILDFMLKQSFTKDGDYQFERGKEGTVHIQGWISFKNPFPFLKLKEYLPRAHIEVARNSNALRNYCKKEATRLEDVAWNPLDDSEMEIKWKHWQIEARNLIDENKVNHRKILWFYDTVGKTGKTWLCRWLVIKRKAAFVHGKANDILYSVRKINPKPDIVCINLSRSKEQWVSYEAIELLKDGLFFCGKYKSKQVVMDPPAVAVFANFPPDVECLSIDRWKIFEISGDYMKQVQASLLVKKAGYTF